MRSRLFLGLGLLAASLASPLSAGQCPEPLRSARQLVLVVASDMNTPTATLQTFTRKSRTAKWKPEGAPISTVVGSAGLGWGWPFRKLSQNGEPLKEEGDKRTPAGFYRFGRPFGFDKLPLHRYMQLEPDKQFCVDAATSPHYSRIIPHDKVTAEVSGERMWEIDLYRRGLVIDYPTDRDAKAGSCIFLHVWKAADSPTVGCVATDEPEVAKLQDWIKPKQAVIAILPASALDRFKDCLP